MVKDGAQFSGSVKGRWKVSQGLQEGEVEPEALGGTLGKKG